MNNQKHTERVHDVYPEIIIFSVDTEGQPYDSPLHQREALERVRGTLQRKGVKFKEVSGCYKGKQQPSFIVSAKHQNIVRNFCFDYMQDNFLIVDQFRNATIKTIAGGLFPAGKLQRISKAEAIEAGNWTLDGSQYWGTK